MKEAAQRLIGRSRLHIVSSGRMSGRSPVRTLARLEVERHGRWIRITVSGQRLPAAHGSQHRGCAGRGRHRSASRSHGCSSRPRGPRSRALRRHHGARRALPRARRVRCPFPSPALPRGCRTGSMRTRIKICGLTREADVAAAIAPAPTQSGSTVIRRARVTCRLRACARWRARRAFSSRRCCCSSMRRLI